MSAFARLYHTLRVDAAKHPPFTWRDQPLEEHLTHIRAHVDAYLAGDRSEDHLGHILARAHFAGDVAEDERWDGG